MDYHMGDTQEPPPSIKGEQDPEVAELHPVGVGEVAPSQPMVAPSDEILSPSAVMVDSLDNGDMEPIPIVVAKSMSPAATMSLPATPAKATSTSSSTDATASAPDTETPRARGDLMQIVMGPKAQPVPEKRPAPVAADSKRPAKKPKTSSRVVKKVLFGKKEQDAAHSLLQGKCDLTAVLPMDVCLFLAEHFWIFTLDQFLSVVKPEAIEQSQSGSLYERMVAALEKEWGNSETSSAEVAPKEAGKPDGSPTDTAPGGNGESESAMDSAVPEGIHGSDVGSTTDTPVAVSESTADAPLTKSEAPVTCDSGGAPQPTRPASNSRLAVERIKEWIDAATSYRRDRTDREMMFALDGPLRHLLPACLQNFFASVEIKSLFQFLSLRKTESGAICDLMAAWRSHCDLVNANRLGVARYLVGIQFRLETAITSIPPFDAMANPWIRDAVVTLTGAAKEFVVDHMNIMTCSDFIAARTKELSLALVDWRLQKQMPPLKGSGKVAMISSWKAIAKESMEVEAQDGRVVAKEILDSTGGLSSQTVTNMKQPDLRGPVSKSKVKTSSVVTGRPITTASYSRIKVMYPPELSRQAQYALHSRLFMEDELGETTTARLVAAGIDTAVKLFDDDCTPGNPLFTVLEKHSNGSGIEACFAVLEGWCRKLISGLEQFGEARPVETTIVVEIKGHDSLDATPSIQQQQQLAQRRENVGSRIVKNSDPFEALSSMTKKFLHSLGVYDAESMLSSRTTDLANAFVQWRLSNGMPELKGLGAIASVSGWKAMCRKAARDLGLHDVASLEPGNRLASTEFAVDPSSEPVRNLGLAILPERSSDAKGKKEWRFAICLSKSKYLKSVSVQMSEHSTSRTDVTW